MTQPINSGAPTPVQGVTGGPGLPQGVAGVEGDTGNVVITPPSNTFQLRKGDSPQALQVYEFYHSQTDNVRIELLTATGGPEFIGVRAAPAGTIRNLQVGTTGDMFLQAGGATRITITGTTGLVTIPIFQIASQLQFNFALVGGTGLQSMWMWNGAPAPANGANGDFWFRTDTPGVANQRLYVKSAGAWVGIL